MPRDDLLKGRVSLPHHVYHVTACTEARRPIFSDFARARLLVGEMRRLQNTALLNSLAWVIMPDHLHWLFQLGERESLSAIVRRLKAGSARAIDRANEFATTGENRGPERTTLFARPPGLSALRQAG